MNREDRLPKWAQNELSMLRNEIVQLQRDLTIHRGNSMGSGETRVVRYAPDGEDIALPNRCTVAFGTRENSIEISYIEGQARVYARNTLLILPRAANCAHLESTTRHI